MGSEDGSSNLRVASFSCYLKTPEDSLVLKLAGMQGAVPPFMTPPETPALRDIEKSSKETHRNLNIIGDGKCYSGRMDYDKLGFMDLQNVKPSIFTARTPSMSSEKNNSNSQRKLLERNPSQIKKRSPVYKRFFLSFGCSGPCSTKKSIYINENVYDSKKYRSQSGFNQADQLSSPVSDPGTEIYKPFEVKVDEDPRKSIEVFGSNDLIKKGDIAKNLERKLSMLTWDAIPKTQEQLPSTTHASTGVCDDMASEASSDLFEIENMCGTGFSPLTRQPSERLSSCSVMSLTTQYPPSEASIPWSVVTASAADFSSVMSEYDENVTSDKNTGKTKTGISKSTSLLGCKTQKSVRISESAYRRTDRPKH